MERVEGLQTSGQQKFKRQTLWMELGGTIALSCGDARKILLGLGDVGGPVTALPVLVQPVHYTLYLFICYSPLGGFTSVQACSIHHIYVNTLCQGGVQACSVYLDSPPGGVTGVQACLVYNVSPLTSLHINYTSHTNVRGVCLICKQIYF